MVDTTVTSTQDIGRIIAEVRVYLTRPARPRFAGYPLQPMRVHSNAEI